jgi:hypothetical protein
VDLSGVLMSHQQLEPLVTILATATIITTIMYIILKQTDFSSPKQLYSLVSFVVLVDNLLLLLFVKFLWKQRALRGWLVSVPNLNGCWIGEIQSTWVDPLTSKRIDPIPVILNVKQTYLGLSAVMITGEMRSESISYQFLYDKEKQINQLIYTYKSTPKQTVKDRSPYHFGTIAFSLIEDDCLSLLGNYWTDRKTTGTITLTYRKRKLIYELPNEISHHPVSALRDNKS